MPVDSASIQSSSSVPSPAMLTRGIWRVLLLAGLVALLSVPIALGCVTAETENNNRDSRADGPLCSASTVSGSIGGNRDVDWYFFDAQPGTVTLSLDHLSSDDFDWYLYPETGSYLESGATSAVPEEGSYEITTAGRYYVKVERYSGTGWYTLDVDFDDGTGSGNGCNVGPRPSKPGGLRNWLTGSGDDACVETTGPALLMMGGGTDVDASFLRIASQMPGGDVVVIRTSGSNGYNDYLFDLMTPDSVETLLLDSRSKADSAYADWVIRSAELLFIAGGDQSDYLNQWEGTATQAAIQHVYDKGGFVGGTSAGLAIQGEAIYDPDGILSVYSEEAVTDACHPYIHLSTGFLSPPFLGDVITDSHFAERDRMGRLLTFMARLGEPSIAPTLQPVTGIGIDEATAMLVDATGLGVVDGAGSVYVLREGASTHRLQVECGAAVQYEGVERLAIGDGGFYDFVSGQSSASPVLIGIDGRFGSFYLPSNPY